MRNRLVPAAAHSYYFRFPDDPSATSVATHIRSALDLASTEWIRSAPSSAIQQQQEDEQVVAVNREP